jgi:spermidine synthase
MLMVNRRLFLYAALFVCVALVRAEPTVLYEKPSLFGTIVVTEEQEGLRVLRFSRDGARQSLVKHGDPEYLGLPYASVVFVGLALCTEPRRMLVVGLGGGTLPMFLRRHYPDAVIDAVDIDPDVVDVAKQFFGFREDGGMRAHVDDGRRFIEQAQRPYDAIFLDAFASTQLPAHLTTQEFLHAVRRAVKPDGVVIGNLWGRNFNPLFDSMVRTYQEVFDELFILDVRGADNKILLALPRAQPLSRAELVGLASGVSTAKRFRFDLGELAGYGFFRAQVKNQEARVLRDPEQPR